MDPGFLTRFAERRRDEILVVWLLALFLLAHAWGGHLRGDALHYAAVMKEMLETGNWLSPTFAGEPYFNKPPLFFWFGAGAFSVLGSSTWVCRFVGALPALAAVVANYHLVKRISGARTALVASVVLASSAIFVRNAGEPRLDAPLLLSIVLAIATLVAGREDRRFLPLFWLAAAAGLGLKGPGGLIPVAIVLAWSVLARRGWPFTDGRFWLGLPLLPLFVGPWLLHNVRVHGDAFERAYFTEDLQATLEGAGASMSPFAKYGLDLVREGWPWIPFILHGAWRSARRWLRGERDGADSLMLGWFVSVAVSILVVQQAYTRYLIPLLPPACWFAADSILALAGGWTDRRLVPVLRGLLVAATVVLAIGPVHPRSRSVPDLVRFRHYLEHHDASRPVLLAGDRVPRRLQATAILYLDTTVRTAGPDALRARAASGPVAFLRECETTSAAEGLEFRTVLAGQEFDLVEARATER